MDAPQCRVCGKTEWRHICLGLEQKPAKPAKQAKTEAPERSRSGDRKAGRAPVPPPVTHVTHKRSNADRQRDYRNAHAEQVRKLNRERMAAKRAA